MDDCVKAAETDLNAEGEAEKKEKFHQYLYLLSGQKHTVWKWGLETIKREPFGLPSHSKSNIVIRNKELGAFVDGKIRANIGGADSHKLLHALCHSAMQQQPTEQSESTQPQPTDPAESPTFREECLRSILRYLQDAVVAAWKAILRIFFTANVSPFIPLTQQLATRASPMFFENQFLATLDEIRDSAELNFDPMIKHETETLLTDWERKGLLRIFLGDLHEV